MKKISFFITIVGAILIFQSCSKAEKGELVNSEVLHPYTIETPKGFPPMSIPANNPMTIEGIALGKLLFYDNILSLDYSMNCGTCHNADYAFSDSENQFSVGIDKIKGDRNAMALFNLGWNRGFFWDAGASNLESQVIGPIQNPIEMHLDLEACIQRLNLHKDYPEKFKKVFNSSPITTAQLMKVIAQFERTIISANSKYDDYKKGLVEFTESEKKGLNLFSDAKKGDCNHCHVLGGNFTDYELRNNGLDSIPVDKGRALITKIVDDEGMFKTPTLRNLKFTSPYMHDGRFKTLQEVLNHYNTGFKYSKTLDPNLEHSVKGRLSKTEIEDIIAFLNTLNDESFIKKKEFRQ